MDAWDELLALGPLDPDVKARTWVKLTQAEATVGVSRSAIRSWYRSNQIPSRLVDGPHGPERLVPLEAVFDRAQLSPRLRRRSAGAVSLEAEMVLLRSRVADLETRLARLEGPGDG